ncbi:hypothetical protein AB2L27_14085 [Kineococcus sp. LSe6-4]|uniref:Integral membrane protein n=1 Tax=Kineococcus halophytocola TaxID=3234027 RepID=A0ABV4H2S3_9ACTN
MPHQTHPTQETGELTGTTGAHPLRTRGPGRVLYAAGLVADLVWLSVLCAAMTPVLSPGFGERSWLLFAVIGVQVASRALRRRAWWYVPLRHAAARPDRVDTAFWTVFAVVVLVLTVVTVRHPPSDAQAFGLWPLLLFSAVPLWFSWSDRGAPEPPGRWGPRVIPCAVAVLAVLVLGATHGRFGTLTAVVTGVVVAAVTAVSQGVRHVRSRRRVAAPR